ncbi:unnamed protein product [Mucor fragilis]
MEALNDVVRSGKVRYIGASSIATWRFQKMNNIAERNGWAKFGELAHKYQTTYSQIAMVWHLAKPFVSPPIIRVSEIEQLYDLVECLKIKLTGEEVNYLEKPYTPRATVLGAQIEQRSKCVYYTL